MRNTCRSESGVATHAMSSNSLAMTSVILSIQEKPLDGLLLVIVVLELNDNLQVQCQQQNNVDDKCSMHYLHAMIGELIPALLQEVLLAQELFTVVEVVG